MFTKTDISRLGNETYLEFSEKYSISCKIKLINSREFWKYAERSVLVQEKIKKRIPVIIGALVVHAKVDTIYVSEDVINTITSDPNFVKAIFMHEFYHIYFKQFLKSNDLNSAIESEFKTKEKMKKDFPKLAKHMGS